MQKPRSPFLEPPGSEGVVADGTGPARPTGARSPPWRQTSFFGIRAQGRFFVYVVDCSGSMIDEDRFARATEVRRSVLALQAPQQFKVIFYNDGPIPMPGGPHPGRPTPRQGPAPRLAPADRARRRDRPPRRHRAGAEPPARGRLPALRRRVPRGDGRDRGPDQPPQDPDPLRGPLRRRGRRPPPPDRPGERRPVRLRGRGTSRASVEADRLGPVRPSCGTPGRIGCSSDSRMIRLGVITTSRSKVAGVGRDSSAGRPKR